MRTGVQSLDLTSLETVKGSYVTDDYRDREDDIIWRVRWSYLLLDEGAIIGDAAYPAEVQNLVAALF